MNSPIPENAYNQMLRVMSEIAAERERQHAKWGEQNHPDGSAECYASVADNYRQMCDTKAKEGTVTFRDILLEEVYEAFAETDPVLLKKELVQVAAVAAAWVEAIDRRLRPAVPVTRAGPREITAADVLDVVTQ